jgi:flagellar hook-length control protein FliK
LSASVSNSSMMLAGFGAPGAATAAGALAGQKGAAVGAAAGFEALLGAMLGQTQDIAGVAINTGAAGATAVDAAGDTKDSKDDKAGGGATDSADATPTQGQVQPDAALLAGLVIPQPAIPIVQTTKTETATTGAAPPASPPAAAQAMAAAATPQPPVSKAATTQVAANNDSPTTNFFAPQAPVTSTPVPPATTQEPATDTTAPQVAAQAKVSDALQAATLPQAKPADAPPQVSTPAAQPAAVVAVAQAQASPQAQAQTLGQIQAPASVQAPAPVQALAAEALAVPATATAPAAKDDSAKADGSKAEPSDALDAAAKPGKAASPAPAQSAAGAVQHQAAGATPDDIAVRREAKADIAAPEADTDTAQAAGSSGPSQTAQTHETQTATAVVRGAPETVAHLAAQIVKKLDGRSTRFDVALDPIGLGHVNVRVEIGAEGRMSAQLAFDNPQAAAELRARANDLHKALEQAGFDLSGGLSFDVASDQGRQHGRGLQQDDNGAAFRGRAFQAALSANDAADATPVALAYSRRAASGVDVRI